MIDVTNRYEDMIEAFECDFSLAKDESKIFSICQLQRKIELKNKRLLKDIKLLGELAFKIRNNKIRIIEK